MPDLTRAEVQWIAQLLKKRHKSGSLWANFDPGGILPNDCIPWSLAHEQDCLLADQILDAVPALLALADAQLAATWQPIETVPDALNDQASRRIHVYFPNVIGEKVQTMTVANLVRVLHAGPTHWMPLPTPPTPQEPR